MPYPTLDSVNVTSDITQLLIYVNDITGGLFMNLFLFSFFLISALGSFFIQDRTVGKADISVSFAVASYLTTGLAFILMLRDGLIAVPVVGICIAISALSTLWLFFSSGK